MSISFLQDSGTIKTIQNISTIQRSLYQTRKKQSNSEDIEISDDSFSSTFSDKMRTQIGSIAQGLTNLDKTKNMIGQTDKSFSELEDQLVEMREVAMDATGSVSTDSLLISSHQENISEAVKFYNQTLSSSSLDKQKLLEDSESVAVRIDEIDEINLSSKEHAVDAVAKIDFALNKLTTTHGEVNNNLQDYIDTSLSNLHNVYSDMVNSESGIQNSNTALEQVVKINSMLNQKQEILASAHNPINGADVFGLIS